MIKKHKSIFIIIILFILTFINCYVSINTYKANKQKPVPLVINNRVEQGTYKGVVFFKGQKGEHTERTAYEGDIRIVFEGKQVRVFIGDAVISDIPEHF